MDAQEIIDRQDADVEKSADQLQAELNDIMHKAEIALLLFFLGARLKVTNGKVDQTVANLQLLQSLPKHFDTILEEYGFFDALRRFMGKFNQQRTVFDKLLKALGHKPIVLHQDKLDLLDAKKNVVAKKFLARVAGIVDEARDQALSALGTPLDVLHSAISERLAKIVPAVKEIARTQLFTFYRGIADLGFQVVQAENPTTPLQYGYYGPNSGDPKIRPFCQRLRVQMEHGHKWTRLEIDALDNGQLPNVFETCGGYECRHQWVPEL